MTTKERMKEIAKYVETQDPNMPLPAFPNEIVSIPTDGLIEELLMEHEDEVLDLVSAEINKAPYNTINGCINNAEGAVIPALSVCRNGDNKITVVTSAIVPTFNNGFRYASYNEETAVVKDIGPVLNCCIAGGAMQDGPNMLIVPIDNPEAMEDGIYMLDQLLDVYENKKSVLQNVRRTDPTADSKHDVEKSQGGGACSHASDCFKCTMFDCEHNEYMKFHRELKTRK